MRRLALLCAMLIVSSSVLAGVTVSASPEREELDADNPLNTPGAIEEFRETGSVTRDVSGMDATLTFATDDGSIPNFSAPADDAFNSWLVLDYREELDRTIRFYLPSNYSAPIRSESVPAANRDDVSAEYVPVDDRRYTAVTVTVTDPGRIILPVDQFDATVFSSLADTREMFETGLGVETPSVSGTEAQWQHIDPEQFDGSSTVVIESSDELTMQFRAGVDGNESVWMPMPRESDAQAPVYAMQKEGSSKIWIVSKTSDPPKIRFKRASDTTGTLESALNDIARIDERLKRTLPFI